MSKNVTKASVDLITNMLKRNPKERLNIIDISNHKWLNKSIDEL